ncbi:MAG TPA: uracil-DNA glycosylase [Burkholderiaceae bacterium]|nr:uracil-DNA glycosylase [Burkholderiaceae bacterium]
MSNRLTQPLDWHIEQLPASWQPAVATPDSAVALEQLGHMIDQRLAEGAVIYPDQPFRALHLTPPDAARIVILGQDPYHGPGQAHGLAFSVPDTVPCPPSLRNILAERNRNFPNLPPRTRQDLSDWAAKGVLLLNAVLTVEHKQPASHAGKGWETITDNLLKHVLGYPTPKVFMLWGRHAQKKRALVDQYASGPVLVLEANHPSPLAANRPPVPFNGCEHFRLAAEWLRQYRHENTDS